MWNAMVKANCSRDSISASSSIAVPAVAASSRGQRPYPALQRHSSALRLRQTVAPVRDADQLRMTCKRVRKIARLVKRQPGAARAPMYVCNCNGIREREVRAAIAAGASRPGADLQGLRFGRPVRPLRLRHAQDAGRRARGAALRRRIGRSPLSSERKSFAGICGFSATANHSQT